MQKLNTACVRDGGGGASVIAPVFWFADISARTRAREGAGMDTFAAARRRKNRGFTLIEAIVVAVIMGILAAVAIPMYIGYIRDQELATVTNLAETGAAAANAYLRRTGSDPTVAQLNLYYNTAKYDVGVDGSANTVTVTDKNNATITRTANY